MAFRFRKNKSGYQVFKDRDGTTRSVHKRVAEKKIGGSIWGGYEVHHRDGNKSNNRPSNLQVLKRSTHRGLHARQRKKSSFW
ncbi:HNH endonuclease [Candidatus Pacearchaeota archaeon CG10_big_fil_rev_8_21_14_0_10_32_42]|nr:MAG: HNH endonuclease [Candidatus Pacearchaeota archaeon CG10_big_fil_rev_8_21_14_0_10_32_42]